MSSDLRREREGSAPDNPRKRSPYNGHPAPQLTGIQQLAIVEQREAEEDARRFRVREQAITATKKTILKTIEQKFPGQVSGKLGQNADNLARRIAAKLDTPYDRVTASNIGYVISEAIRLSCNTTRINTNPQNVLWLLPEEIQTALVEAVTDCIKPIWE